MINLVTPSNQEAYDAFHQAHPGKNYGLDRRWAQALLQGYGRKVHHLLYTHNQQVEGIGALVSFLRPGGKIWVGMPYMDFGGILVSQEQFESSFITELAGFLKGRPFELRNRMPLQHLSAPLNTKRSMLLDISGTTQEALWSSFDAKVRNQVRKAQKEGVEVKWGAQENLQSFYPVFAKNMRDLGSPVHGLKFFKAVFDVFPEMHLGLALYKGEVIGGLVRLHWGNELVLPWASTLREYRHLCPNNALYWSALCYAFESKCKQIDFGRSTQDEGTYKFKKQWLAQEFPLPWYPFNGLGKLPLQVEHLGQGKLSRVAEVWAKLPLPLANFLGPKIRGHLPA